MSSCPSKSKDEEFKEARQEFIREDFRKIIMQASFDYLSSKDFLPDFAFNVDRKGAIIKALQDVIDVLEGKDVNTN